MPWEIVFTLVISLALPSLWEVQFPVFCWDKGIIAVQIHQMFEWLATVFTDKLNSKKMKVPKCMFGLKGVFGSQKFEDRLLVN